MKRHIKNLCLICIGWLSLMTGVIGIFLPLLPTTVFILIAAFCFANSSKKFHGWHINHSYLGPIISSWEQNRGISSETRKQALFSLWFGLGLSMCLLWDWRVAVILIVVGIGVSAYLIKLPTVDKGNDSITQITLPH